MEYTPLLRQSGELLIHELSTLQLIRILYFSNKLKNVIRDHQDALDYYLVEALKESDIKNLEDDLSNMDVSPMLLDDVRKVSADF